MGLFSVIRLGVSQRRLATDNAVRRYQYVRPPHVIINITFVFFFCDKSLLFVYIIWISVSISGCVIASVFEPGREI